MKRCINCIMDETDPNITFDEKGICNHCKNFYNINNLYGFDKEKSPILHEKTIKLLKDKGKKKEFDCIIGLSGGVDSSYLLHHAVLSGLRVLAVHVDAGWNSEIAVKNIHNLCQKLNVQLHTIVIDWPTMRELQRAYMFSGLPNLDIPQDHAFLAATYAYALKNKVYFMLNGSNIATEGILPISWGYSNIDFTSIKDVFKKHKRKGNLKKYPHFGLFKYLLIYKQKIKRINLLNQISYSKKVAMETLHKLYSWQYYGGKHFESRFTKFFQSYYLPLKFGYDKRLAHLSSLIVNSELTREEALLELNKPVYDEKSLQEDRDYILKKLDLNVQDWDKIIFGKNKSEDDYKNQKYVMEFLKKINLFKRKLLIGK